MKRCNHTEWLTLHVNGGNVSLHESDRVQTLIAHVTNPEVQRPGLIVFLGNTAKAVALSELFGLRVKQARNRRAIGEIHLHFDPTTVSYDHPLFFADGDFPRQAKPLISKSENCHATTHHSLVIPSGSSVEDAADAVYCSLLYPFTDVFCFFAADLGGFKQVARRLAAWIERQSVSSLPSSKQPKVIIVADLLSPSANYEKNAKTTFLWLLRRETKHNVTMYVSSIEVVALVPEGRISPEARYRHLKERLLDGLDQIRLRREEKSILFSATHFAAFLRLACEHFCKSSGAPFDFLRASRAQNPVSETLNDHIFTFLDRIGPSEAPDDFVIDTIASSLILDSYPPESHRFNPRYVFITLYREQISNAISRTTAKHGLLNHRITAELVEKKMVKWFEHACVLATADMHRAQLQKFQIRWAQIFSTSTCLSCLRRRPQYNLPCKHTVCENCVLVFGHTCVDDPWVYEIHRCWLCGSDTAGTISIRMHPPTAGTGVLCIDGGGVRGMIPLQLLKRLQECIGLPIPLQRFFKVAFGISSGALIVLGLFINGFTVEQSSEVFEELSQHAFAPRKVLNIPFFSRLQQVVLSYIGDSLYPAENIEAPLKTIFGTDRSILDYSHATLTGTKVGIPVATADEKPHCKNFTNYNGANALDENDNRIIHLNDDGYGRIPLWEVARAASAAPGFFPPKHIKGIGTFQDAGPLENNPIISALTALRAVSPSIKRPDFVVSLGTGSPRIGETTATVVGQLRFWHNRTLLRLYRLFMEKTRDRIIASAFQSDPTVHRLDVDFEGDEPRLDDVSSISALKTKVQSDHSLSAIIASVARKLTASLFYFELDTVPEKINGEYRVNGAILCTLHYSDPAYKALIEQLSRDTAEFLINNVPLPGSFDDDLRLYGVRQFRRSVSFNVAGDFEINLQRAPSNSSGISGSPFSVNGLLTSQGFNAFFGRSDHKKRKVIGDDTPRKRRRL